MKKMLFVFNPHSGKAQIKNVLLRIIEIFSMADYEVTVYPTKAPMDGYKHILESEGKYDVVVCSGGDGTLNETVGAILKYSDPKPPIGYIPSGTTNDFATSLNIPRDMVRAAEHIALGSPLKCDIGMLDGERSFNYVAAFGAFTEVSYETPQTLKNVLGHQAYVIEGVKSLAALKPYYVRVRSDKVNVEGNFVYGMVSNTKSVGGIKGLVGSSIDLQDGLFEVTLIKEIRNPLELQQVVTAFITQSVEKCDMIYSFKTHAIEFESVEEISWTLDGEFGGNHKKVRFEVINNAVEFLVKKRKRVITKV
jgi:YegS/Rv2252/BmrU family lipid kinase